MPSREARLVLPFVAVLMLLPATANAAEHEDCRTISDRRLDDAVVSLARGSSEHTRALDILEGEVLCVRLRPDGDGFQVVDSGSRDDTLRIELQRMARRAGVREKQVVLSVRASRRHGLTYRAALSLGASHDVREVLSFTTQAGENNSFGWPLSDRIRHHLLIFDVVELPPPEKPTRPRPNFLGISVVSSLHRSDLGELNAELGRNGFRSVSSVQPYLGFAFDGGIGRFRASWDLEVGLGRPGAEGSPFVYGFLIAVHVGFAVHRSGGFALFPMLGIAGGDQRVSVEPDRPAIFPAALGALPNAEDIRKNVGSLLISLGSEQRIPMTGGRISHGGLLLGARAGYAFQFTQSAWLRQSSSGSDLPVAPDVDTSGPYLRLGIGWYEE